MAILKIGILKRLILVTIIMCVTISVFPILDENNTGTIQPESYKYSESKDMRNIQPSKYMEKPEIELHQDDHSQIHHIQKRMVASNDATYVSAVMNDHQDRNSGEISQLKSQTISTATLTASSETVSTEEFPTDFSEVTNVTDIPESTWTFDSNMTTESGDCPSFYPTTDYPEFTPVTWTENFTEFENESFTEITLLEETTPTEETPTVSLSTVESTMTSFLNATSNIMNTTMQSNDTTENSTTAELTTTTYDPCEETVCQNNGTCVYEEGEKCYCQDWFMGDECEIEVRPYSPEIEINRNDSLEEGSALNAICRFMAEVSSTKNLDDFPVDIKWKLNGVSLDNSSRITIYHVPLEDVACKMDTSSKLSIKKLDHRDTDLECEVEVRNPPTNQKILSLQSEKEEIRITRLPNAHLTPRAAHLKQGESEIFSCEASPFDADVITIQWFINDMPEDEKNMTFGQASRFEYKEEGVGDHILSCKACFIGPNDKCGPRNTSAITVSAQNANFCPPNTDSRNVNWSQCVEAGAIKGVCPAGQQGESSRRCIKTLQGAVWESANYINCVDAAISAIDDEVDYLIENGANDTTAVENALGNLVEATSGDDLQPTDPGNINVAAKILEDLARARNGVGTADISANEIGNAVSITSNLLRENNKDTWQNAVSVNGNLTDKVLQTVDLYSVLRTQRLPLGQVEVISQKNLEVDMQAVDIDDIKDLSFPLSTSHKQTMLDTNDTDWLTDTVIIPQELLENITNYFEGSVSGKLPVSVTFYKSMHVLISSELVEDNTTSEEVTDTLCPRLASRIVSVVLPDNGGSPYISPIEMNFEMNNITCEDSRQGLVECQYWSVEQQGWSTEGVETVDNNGTNITCLSNHTTNFGLIMRPDFPLSEKHQKVLTALTHTFLILSTICMIITIGVYGAHWKKLKSHHGIMLINLCVALVAGHVVFMIEAWRTPDEPWVKSPSHMDEQDYDTDTEQNSAGCIAVGILLHFFYVASFCIMMAEGVQILTFVTCVFRPKRYGETYWLVAAAWVSAGVIVAVTAGIEKGQGYGASENGGSCWLQLNDDYGGSFWAFAGPMIAIIVANLVIACVVQYKSFKSTKLTNTDRARVRTGVWNLLVLCPVLGISWIFGIFTLTDAKPAVTLAFLYLFTIFATLQGFFIFLFHCILHKKVRDLMRNCGEVVPDRSREILGRAQTYLSTGTNGTFRPGSGTTSEEEFSSNGYSTTSFSGSNPAFITESPVIHREEYPRNGAPSLYAPSSTNGETREGSQSDSPRLRSSTAGTWSVSLPGFPFQFPDRKTFVPPIDWETFLSDVVHDEFIFEDDGYNSDAHYTYF